jgi:hypothetical protein
MEDVDLDIAYDAYLERFRERFGKKPEGAFVKFHKHMVQKLTRKAFPPKLRHYLELHATCKQMLKTGATINDAVVLEFDEAAAWLAIEAPDMLKMFSGEIGDPDVATGIAHKITRG